MLLLEKNKFCIEIEKKLLDPTFLERTSFTLKKAGKKVVTINGSFDLLHPGHLDMLYKAKRFGDALIVLLNTDSSIQKYKSLNRPINPLEVRLQHIAALEAVDYVSWFEETDPREVLKKTKPDIHVNGSEYGENCIEADVVKEGGGKVEIVDLLPGYSTTRLIERIRCD